MGVHGLTTFIEGLQKTERGYKDKIIIRSSPIVIDGSNLMYYLYFDGKTPVVGKGAKPSLDLATANSSPKAHLYGGDWTQYAQNVRYFFQQLKHCHITAIVIFDGAYDATKIEVSRRRFAQTIYENVKQQGQGVVAEPGKSYTPIFLKSVFLEVLAEQKIAHYQTVGEADPTIALVAKLLGRCPILSSDSDFYIYAEAKPVALKSLKFSLKQGKGDVIEENSPPKKNQKTAPKVWTLEGEYVSIEKICQKEFGLDNQEMLPLAAVIIGNDSIVTSFFTKFKNGDTLKTRIAGIFKWLARQKSVASALHLLVNHVSPEKRQLVASAMRYNLEMYKGENGEKKIWERIKEDVDVSAWIDTKLDQRICFRKSKENKDEAESLDNFALCLGNQGNIKCVVREPSKGSDPETEKKAKILSDANGNLKAEVITRTIPEWYRLKHISCELQTYLLNILKNQVVFLAPQVEMYENSSSHEMSIPIIRVIAGILLGDADMHILLETHRKGRPQTLEMTPVLELPNYGLVPFMKDHYDDGDGVGGKGDFSKSIPHENRLKLILATLGVDETDKLHKFYEGWPASYRIWVATLMYFVRTKLYGGQAQGHDPSISLAVMTAIFLCIIKNLVVNPGKLVECPQNATISSISELHKVTDADPEKLETIRNFYRRFEEIPKIMSGKSKKSTYDITLSHYLSQYLCIVFHTEMLNNLMGNPLKSPKVRYMMNNYFIYNFSSYITERIAGLPSDGDFSNYKDQATGVTEIDGIMVEFLGFCNSIV